MKKFGLMKIGTGEGDQMMGKVYIHKDAYRRDERVKLLYLNGKLLLRSAKDHEQPFYVIDPFTLEETKEDFDLEKDQPTVEWREDKDNNRYMTDSPLFTDSNFIYVVSYKKPEKGKLNILIVVRR